LILTRPQARILTIINGRTGRHSRASGNAARAESGDLGGYAVRPPSPGIRGGQAEADMIYIKVPR